MVALATGDVISEIKCLLVAEHSQLTTAERRLKFSNSTQQTLNMY
jgi:hypothetical protein